MFCASPHTGTMGLFAKFSLSKLRAALQGKDWKEVEKRQNKMGIQVFLARRGIGYKKHVAVVRSMPRNKLCSYCIQV